MKRKFISFSALEESIVRSVVFKKSHSEFRSTLAEPYINLNSHLELLKESKTQLSDIIEVYKSSQRLKTHFEKAGHSYTKTLFDFILENNAVYGNFFGLCIDSNLLKKKDLNLIVHSIDDAGECISFKRNLKLLQYFIQHSSMCYDKLTTILDSKGLLYHWIKPEYFMHTSAQAKLELRNLTYQKMLEAEYLQLSDLLQLLKLVENDYDLRALYDNEILMRQLLVNLLLTEQIVEKHNTIIKDSISDRLNGLTLGSWFVRNSIHMSDDLFKHFYGYTVSDLRVLYELNKLSNRSCITQQQRDCLLESLNVQYMFENFKFIIENQLEDTFESFDDLMKHVNKKEKKHILIV